MPPAKSKRRDAWSTEEVIHLLQSHLEVLADTSDPDWEQNMIAAHNMRFRTRRTVAAWRYQLYRRFGKIYPAREILEKGIRKLTENESGMKMGLEIEREVVEIEDDSQCEEDEDIEEGGFEVENIVGHGMSKRVRGEQSEMLFEVKWKGYRETSWEPAGHFGDPSILLEYMEHAGLNFSNDSSNKKSRTDSPSTKPRGRPKKIARTRSYSSHERPIERPTASTSTRGGIDNRYDQDLKSAYCRIQELEQQVKTLTKKEAASKAREQKLIREQSQTRQNNAFDITCLRNWGQGLHMELQRFQYHYNQRQPPFYRTSTTTMSQPQHDLVATDDSILVDRLREEARSAQGALQELATSEISHLKGALQVMKTEMEGLRRERDLLLQQRPLVQNPSGLNGQGGTGWRIPDGFLRAASSNMVDDAAGDTTQL